LVVASIGDTENFFCSGAAITCCVWTRVSIGPAQAETVIAPANIHESDRIIIFSCRLSLNDNLTA